MAQVIVQACDRTGKNSRVFIPRTAFAQNRLGSAADKKGTPERGRCLMKQQIAMMLPVCGKELIEQKPQSGAGLLGVAKGGARRGKLSESGGEHFFGDLPRFLRRHPGRFNFSPKLIQAAQE